VPHERESVDLLVCHLRGVRGRPKALVSLAPEQGQVYLSNVAGPTSLTFAPFTVSWTAPVGAASYTEKGTGVIKSSSGLSFRPLVGVAVALAAAQ